MNSNANNDILRRALQRRAERMAPAPGWEKRVLAETPAPRRRQWLKWLTIPAAAAAVIAIAIGMPEPAQQIEPMQATQEIIAEAPAAVAEPEPAPEPARAPHPAPVQAETTVEPDNEAAIAEAMLAKYDAQRVDIDAEISVIDEIEALLYAYK